jgi:hypothetical protein
MYPEAKDEASNKAIIEEHRARKNNARIFDGFPVRSWDRWLDERQARRIRHGLDEDGLPVGPRATCSQERSFAASAGYAGRQTIRARKSTIEFTPDSQSLVFAATTNRKRSGLTPSRIHSCFSPHQGGETEAS